MNYPFPPTRPTLLLEWAVILTLLVLALVPVVRIVARRKQPPNWRDMAIGFVALIGAILVGKQFPLLHAGLPHPQAMPVASFMAFVVTALLTWSFAALLMRTTTLINRTTEIVIPYAAGMGVLFVLTPACSYYGEPMYRSMCRNNLKQILLGFHNFLDKHETFPALLSSDAQPPRSWRVDLLPYLDLEHVRNQYVEAAAWDASQNAPVTNNDLRFPLPYFCPGSHHKADNAGRPYSAYFGVRGPNTLFPEGVSSRIKDVTDGTSNTIAVVEACGTPIVWTEPRDIDLAEQDVGVNLPGEQPGRSNGVISSYHREGGHVGLADGSVRFVSDKVDPNVLRAALTANGGEAPPEF
jgi:hypothetical protein